MSKTRSSPFLVTRESELPSTKPEGFSDHGGQNDKARNHVRHIPQAACKVFWELEATDLHRESREARTLRWTSLPRTWERSWWRPAHRGMHKLQLPHAAPVKIGCKVKDGKAQWPRSQWNTVQCHWQTWMRALAISTWNRWSLASHFIQTRGKSQVSEVPVNDLISLPSKTLNRGNLDFPFYEVPFPDLLVDQAFSLAESNHCLATATHNTATPRRRGRRDHNDDNDSGSLLAMVPSSVPTVCSDRSSSIIGLFISTSRRVSKGTKGSLW